METAQTLPDTAKVLEESESARELLAAAPRMFDSLEAYRLRRAPVGGFLSSCLANDFVDAASNADQNNKRLLAIFARYIYNCLPSNAWGSRARVRAWTSGEPAPRLPKEILEDAAAWWRSQDLDEPRPDWVSEAGSAL